MMRPSAIPTILRRIDWLKIGMGAGQWAEGERLWNPIQRICRREYAQFGRFEAS
jgi:hypothetical protein